MESSSSSESRQESEEMLSVAFSSPNLFSEFYTVKTVLLIAYKIEDLCMITSKNGISAVIIFMHRSAK